MNPDLTSPATTRESLRRSEGLSRTSLVGVKLLLIAGTDALAIAFVVVGGLIWQRGLG